MLIRVCITWGLIRVCIAWGGREATYYLALPKTTWHFTLASTLLRYSLRAGVQIPHYIVASGTVHFGVFQANPANPAI